MSYFARPVKLFLAVAVVATVPHAPSALPQQTAKPSELTVDRIYSQPSLSGRLTRGVAWTPDGKKISFFEPKGHGGDAKTELWGMDA